MIRHGWQGLEQMSDFAGARLRNVRCAHRARGEGYPQLRRESFVGFRWGAGDSKPILACPAAADLAAAARPGAARHHRPGAKFFCCISDDGIQLCEQSRVTILKIVECAPYGCGETGGIEGEDLFAHVQSPACIPRSPMPISNGTKRVSPAIHRTYSVVRRFGARANDLGDETQHRGQRVRGVEFIIDAVDCQGVPHEVIGADRKETSRQQTSGTAPRPGLDHATDCDVGSNATPSASSCFMASG